MRKSRSEMFRQGEADDARDQQHVASAAASESIVSGTNMPLGEAMDVEQEEQIAQKAKEGDQNHDGNGDKVDGELAVKADNDNDQPVAGARGPVVSGFSKPQGEGGEEMEIDGEKDGRGGEERGSLDNPLCCYVHESPIIAM